MFCTECGQNMADEAKFCAYCGTRRVIPTAGREAAPPARPEPPVVPPPPSPVPAPPRAIRSTAEIMPIRAQRPAVPPPPVESPEPETEPDDLRHVEEAVPWHYEQESPAPPASHPEPPPHFAPPPVSRPPARPAASPAADGYRSVPFAADPGSREEPRKTSPVLIGAIVVALIALAGIGWMVRSTMSSSTAAPVTISIYPTSAKLAVGKSADFAATLTGPPNDQVVWTVDEGDSGGQVQIQRGQSGTNSLYSTYTAPQKPGTYHLVATSTADKTKSATADITVTGK
jgi:hypothetical protein